MSFDWFTVLSPWLLLASIGGASFGLLWGAIPGLSVNMALALLLGLSFHWPIDTTIVFLVATWLAGEFGGALPAICNNIPGTPAAVPTQLAGYPLALRGEAGAAIALSLLASVIGGMLGVLFLIVASPLLAASTLYIGSWELALLSLIGVAIAGSLGGESGPVRGWIMGTLGLLLGLIGTDPLTGAERWTFGLLELRSGLGVLPVLIGLFAVAEAIDVLARTRQKPIRGARVSLRVSLVALGRVRQSILRSSLIGAAIGAIPGIGASIASFVSYSVGQRRCGRRFDQGDHEGVVCSEVANNANVGGALVPTLFLGLPGNKAAILFMGALTMHGIVVGPTVRLDQPGLLGFLFAALLVANLALLLCAPIIIRIALQVLTMRTELLMPIVLVLAVCGTYAASYSQFDLVVLVLSGTAGYGLKRAGFPLAPLVLGLILAPGVDQHLRRALLITEGDLLPLLARPASLVILSLGVVGIALGIRRRLGAAWGIGDIATVPVTEGPAEAKRASNN